MTPHCLACDKPLRKHTHSAWVKPGEAEPVIGREYDGQKVLAITCRKVVYGGTQTIIGYWTGEWGGYGDGFFCGLTCGHRYAVRTLNSARTTRRAAPGRVVGDA